MKIDEKFYCNNGEIQDAMKIYLQSINKNNITFKDEEALFEACKEMVTKDFGSEDEDRFIYLERVKELYFLMKDLQA